MNEYIEIQTTQKWLIDYDFGIHAMRLVNAMMNGHLVQPAKEKVLCEQYYAAADGTFFAQSPDHGESHDEDAKRPFINVLHLEGLLTREGGACTYGSRELRDLMMEAANHEECLGHLLIINGPGGVSNSIPDLMQATEYARSKGQPIVGRIDGMCFSAHIWASAMCDEVYYNNPADQIGSVGIYWAGLTNKNGDTDPGTGGTWHIVYDPESYDKNRFYRDLAENNDDTLIKEELTRDGETFRNFIKSRRPNATDEHLHGKTFDCKDVEGILVNGQATMQEVFERIIALHNATTATSSTNMSNQNTNTFMKEKFPALFAALQVEEMQMTEEGTFMNAELMARLNDALTAKQEAEAAAEAAAEETKQPAEAAEAAAEKPEGEQPAAEAAEQAAGSAPSGSPAGEGSEAPAGEAEQATAEALANAEAEIDRINETLHNAEALVEERDKTIADMQETLDATASDLAKANDTIAERDNAISEKDAAIEALTKERDEATSQLSTLNAQLSEKDSAIAELQTTIEAQKQTLAEKEAEIKELAGTATPMTDGKEGIPADNGVGEIASGPVRSVITADMTPAEIRAALRKKDEETKARRNKR